MADSLLTRLPEVFVSTAALSTAVSRGVRDGSLRKIGPRLYTKSLRDTPEEVVRRHLWEIVSSYYPNALIADRTAFELAPSSDGSVFLVTDSGRDVVLPGVRLRPRRGHGRIDGDYPFRDGVWCMSPARAFLENMRPSRARSGVARTLSRRDIERQLEAWLRRSGEDALNQLRDQISATAPILEMEEEARALDQIIGALLGTREDTLVSREGRARREGHPFDPRRIRLFEELHAALRRLPPEPQKPAPPTGEGETVLAFFEAYLSNFIEGTEFAVQEAADIVFRNVIPANRPDDAHDVQGTFEVVANAAEMRKRPETAEDFLRLLRHRHQIIMGGRPDKRPGTFKFAGNRAGSTSFVAPVDVIGTLSEGFAFYRQLDEAFHRAVFMMFLVSEVHPFDDGNGRIARVMMNAELVQAEEPRIIIPTIYRTNYIQSLKALSLNNSPDPLIRTLAFAQRYTSLIPWVPFELAWRVLDQTHAFMDPSEADAVGERLRLPSPEQIAEAEGFVISHGAEEGQPGAS